jgi:hypothetical protein
MRRIFPGLSMAKLETAARRPEPDLQVGADETTSRFIQPE